MHTEAFLGRPVWNNMYKRKEGSRTEQREKLDFDAIARQFPANPTGSSGAGITFGVVTFEVKEWALVFRPVLCINLLFVGGDGRDGHNP